MLFNTMKLLCLLFLSSHLIEAKECQNRNSVKSVNSSNHSFKKKSHKEKNSVDCRYANAFRAASNPSDWYNISPPPFTQQGVFPPTVAVSKKRSGGFKHNALQLLSKGVKILKSGTYQVNYAAILLNMTPNITAPVTVFLVDASKPQSPEAVYYGTAESIPYQSVTTTQGSVVVKLKHGTRLALTALNGGSDNFTLTVLSWNISLSEIPTKD